jgi:hypothetical protein
VDRVSGAREATSIGGEAAPASLRRPQPTAPPLLRALRAEAGVRDALCARLRRRAREAGKGGDAVDADLAVSAGEAAEALAGALACAA